MGDFEVFNKEYTTDSMGDLGPMNIIVPFSGKRLSIHEILITTKANSGTINLDFSESNEEVTRFYPEKTTSFSSVKDNTMGNIDEPLILSGEGLGNGQKVYLKIQYLER